MTPQERQMLDELFDRLARLESAPRDPDATAAIAQGLQKAPPTSPRRFEARERIHDTARTPND